MSKRLRAGVVVFAAAYVVLASSLQAASVMSWSTPVSVTNVSDINLTGALVHAGCWAGSNLLVDVDGTNTVLFEDRPIEMTDDEAGVTANVTQGPDGRFYSGDTSNAAFNAVMDSNAGGRTKELTLKKLIPGATYQVQLFLSDERAAEGPRTQKWSDHAIDGAGNESAALQRNQAPSVIGTFTADATSQILYGLPLSHADTIISGYVLRKTVDAAPGVLLNPTSGSVVEGGMAASYELQTTTVPASLVTLLITPPAGLEVSADGVAFFTNGTEVVLDGVTPGTVSYRALDDGVIEPTEIHEITHAVVGAGDGGDYPGSLTIDPFPVSVADALIANVGAMAVYNNAGAAPVTISAENGGIPSVVNTFTTAAIAPPSTYALAGDGSRIFLSAGKHLVLYNNRVDHVSGDNRAEVLAHLSLEDGDSTNDLAYGRAQGFIRYANGADETVLSGGTIINVTDAASTLRLHTARSDVNSGKTVQIEPGHTAIQLLKLDDTFDYLRVCRTTNTLGATTTTFTPVIYDTVDEAPAAPAGAMTFTSGSDSVILTSPGHYLVLANTHLKRTDSREFTGSASSNTRSGYTQRLTLNSLEIEGSKTTTYIRGSGNAEEADDGTLTIGMIVEAAGISVLRVEHMKESGVNCNIIGGKTALTIVKLPDNSALITLQDTTGQNINQGTDGGDASPPVPVTFATQLGTPATAFSHSISNSQVTVNRAGRYLFLGAFFCDDDGDLRQVPNQQWSVNGTMLGYGESSRYSRNDLVHNNGNWSGILADLASGDAVEMTSRRLAQGGSVPGHSLGLQGVDLLSFTTNPVLVANEGLDLTAAEAAIITASRLLTMDADTPASNLVYTVDTEPTGGTLYKGVSALSTNDTFTQADIDSGDVTFQAGAALGKSLGFTFSVTDGGSSPVPGFFTIKVVEPIVVAADDDATDEDTWITAAFGGTNVLANDTGDTLTVTGYDGVSANGAAVVVNADGSFRYDPAPGIPLQMLAAGESTNDTFTYTVTDVIGKMATATVTVDVTGIEDAFAAVDNYVDDPANRVSETAGASITVDLTANDGIVRTANGATNVILFLNYDAAASAGAGAWENTGLLGGTAMDWLLGSGVTLNAVASGRGGISAAYKWDGTTAATGLLRGGWSVHDILGNTIDTASATFEFWVKPDTADLGQNSTLFETGGGTGVGIIIGSNGVLRAANNILVGEVTYDLLADTQGLVGGNPTGEFFHVAFAVDFENDLNSLYINGVLVGTAANTTPDWDGGDGSGLGHFGEANHGGFQSGSAGTVYDTYYHGSIAAFRIYGEALTAAEVYQNFQAIDLGGTDIEGDTLTVSGVYDANTNLVAGTGIVVTVASGAAVTLDATDGSFTYDPTGIPDISDLKAGETSIDTFDIQVVDGNGQVDAAAVRVTIHGLNSPVDDTLEARELAVTTFAASELVGNDQRPADVVDPLIRLDARDVTVSNAASRVWVNTGTAGATYNGTVNGGTLVAPASGFGGLGTAWEDPRITVASLDAVSTADTTFEVWFKPRFGSGGKQSLFETGGNVTGLSIVYDADRNRVVCTLDGGDDADSNLQLQVDVGGVSYDEFNQVVLVYGRNTPTPTDSLTVYLNNNPAAFMATPAGVATNAAGANDFSGTDGTGIGAMSGTAALNVPLVYFDGQIAIARVYTRALSTAEIEESFDAVAQPVLDLPPGSPVTTALGATVTLNADGSVTYDATSLSTNIPGGEVRQDSFTYAIDDGIGGTSVATVTVNVTGVGSLYAVDDMDVVNEDGPACTFDPVTNDVGAFGATIELQSVVANYQTDYQGGTVVGETADFSGTTGWRYLWNAPADWGGTNSLDATTGPFGDSANYELLKWTGAYWSPDGDTNNFNGDPGGWLKLHANGLGHPGLGPNQVSSNTNTLPRGPIAAYTVDTNGFYGIANSRITKTPTAGDPIHAIVYVNDTLIGTKPVAPGDTVSFDTELGELTGGDTIYLAVSPGETAGNDGFSLDYDIVKLPGAGAAVVDTLGTVTTDGNTITYDPNGLFEVLAVGQSVYDTFVYTIHDGSNVSSATVTMEIQGDNDAPVGVAAAIAADEDNSAAGTLDLSGCTDIDHGDVLLGFGVAGVQGMAGNTNVAVGTDGGGLITMQNDGSYVYDPNGAFDNISVGDSGTDTFTYFARDAHGLAATVSATVAVTIAGRDDGVIATVNAYELAADTNTTGNVITDDTGDGVDVSIDDNDKLTVLSVDASGVQGVLTIGSLGTNEVFMGTRGTVTGLVDDVVQTITFDPVGGRFTDPVVFANPPSYNEAEPTIVIVSNVTATAFDIRLKEQPDSGPNSDGDGEAHAAESFTWMVFEAGRYRLASGALMEVGKTNTAAIQHDGPGGTSWQTVTFTVAFATNPVVFNQIQTWSGSTNEKAELFGTRMNGSASLTGFQVALEDHEGDTNSRVTAETIGWMAVEPGVGTWSGNYMEAGITPAQVDQTWYTINFAQDYSTVPDFIASQATISGVDPTQLRIRNLDNNSVEILGAEDKMKDTEVGHASEQATYLAVGGTGDLTGYPASGNTVDGSFTYDPNGVFDRLGPGRVGTEIFTYTVTDGFGNTDTKTVTITVTDVSAGMLIIVR